MKVEIVFVNDKPKMSIYGLEGVLLELDGRPEYIVRKDPQADTLAAWFKFFIERDGHNWSFGYKSNYSDNREKQKRILSELLDKANGAIKRRTSVDLSREFDAFNEEIEPFVFSGLFAQMNERYHPISLYEDLNQDIDQMRAFIKENVYPEQLEKDEHIYNFVNQIPVEIIWVDDTEKTGE